MPTALVTGSTKGIGKAFISALAEDGYDVIIHYYQSAAEAEALAEELRLKVRVTCFQADLRDARAAQTLIEKSFAQFNGLDVLINNVGNYAHSRLETFPLELWHEMFASNLHSCFYTCQTAIPLMKAQGGGRIINIGYAGAEQLIARPGIAAYSIAKTGVILYSKALAKSYAANNITVNVISPGVIESSVALPVTPIPMQRLGYLSEMVGAMRYLLSPAAAYVTGITLEVAGGWNI
ncbi:MAG: SDR family oxidoreductase [Deinococcales bacterium]